MWHARAPKRAPSPPLPSCAPCTRAPKCVKGAHGLGHAGRSRCASPTRDGFHALPFLLFQLLLFWNQERRNYLHPPPPPVPRLPNPRGGLRGRSRGRSARSGSGGKQVDAGVEGPWWEGRGGISILPPAGLADAAFTAPWERQGAFTVTLRITK